MKLKFMLADSKLKGYQIGLKLAETIEVLAKNGVSWSDDEGDYWAVEDRLLQHLPEDQSHPKLVWETQSEHTAVANPALVNRKDVVVWFKSHTAFKNAKLNNVPLIDGYYHTRLIRDAMPQLLQTRYSKPPSAYIKEDCLHKIQLLYNQMFHRTALMILKWHGYELPDKRETDVQFSGRIDGKTFDRYSPLITYHRQLFWGKANDIKGASLDLSDGYKYTGKPYQASRSNAPFWRALLNSKIVLSPWGVGETSLRDFQAVYCGCTLIKPNWDYAYTWPDIPYVPCAVDFSDLQEIVERELDCWDKKQEIRQGQIDKIRSETRGKCVAERLIAFLGMDK